MYGLDNLLVLDFFGESHILYIFWLTVSRSIAASKAIAICVQHIPVFFMSIVYDYSIKSNIIQSYLSLQVAMKEVQISTFKAQCLSLLDRVSRTKEGLTITRHGKPLVVIHPIQDPKPRKGFGIAKGTIEIKEDIIEPATDISDWEALN